MFTKALLCLPKRYQVVKCAELWFITKINDIMNKKGFTVQVCPFFFFFLTRNPVNKKDNFLSCQPDQSPKQQLMCKTIKQPPIRWVRAALRDAMRLEIAWLKPGSAPCLSRAGVCVTDSWCGRVRLKCFSLLNVEEPQPRAAFWVFCRGVSVNLKCSDASLSFSDGPRLMLLSCSLVDFEII